MPTRTLYEILGVEKAADQAEIRRAYLRLAKVSHPDVGGNAALFGMVTDAYETLSDPLRRSSYDRELRTAGSSAQPEPPRNDSAEGEPPRTGSAEPAAPAASAASAARSANLRRPPLGGPGRYAAAGALVVWGSQLAIWLPAATWRIPTLVYPTSPDLTSLFDGVIGGLTAYAILRPRPLAALFQAVNLRILAGILGCAWVAAIFLGWMLLPASLVGYLIYNHFGWGRPHLRTHRLRALWRHLPAHRR